MGLASSCSLRYSLYCWKQQNNTINNEGALVFEYDLEDTDTPNGANVFTGQNSALWHNVRDVYAAERRTMYQNLRSGTTFNYETINKKMADHQSVWPEAIWNEDKYNKYIGSLINKGQDYLEMLQGDKKAQRDWWLYNGFKYRDSKYNAGDALTNFITLRCYEVGNITVTPYSHICPRIKYGSVYAGGERVKRNTPVELVCTQDEMDDTEVYIYSADRIASVGDLSHLKVGLAVFSDATKLQNIILGSDAEGYDNPNLYSLEVGNNELLTLVNVTNCSSEKFTSLDVSGCHGLETILAEGTKLTGVALPDGGHLKTLKLPATIANLTIQNQKNIETLTLESQENLSTLRIEGTPGLPIETLINNSTNLNRVRLTNIEWDATNEETLRVTINKLINAKGLDANGLNLDKAVVTGRVNIKTISESFLEEINDHFPELIVVVDGVAKYFVRYADWDNTLLYRYIASEGTAAIDPITAGYIEQPSRENTETAQYEYRGWSETPAEIYRPYSIIAKYDATYLVTFHFIDGTVGNQQWVKEYESATEPVENHMMITPTKESTAQYAYYFSGWDRDYTYIEYDNISFYPTFREELRMYPVYFKNDDTMLYETKVYYGSTATYLGDIPTNEIYKYINGEPSQYYEFCGWSPNVDEPIIGPMTFRATFEFNGYIEDDWATIAANCAAGDISKYGIGGRKRLEYNITLSDGNVYTSAIEVEIVGQNHDILAKTDASYNGGKNTAALTFMAYNLGLETYAFNITVPPFVTEAKPNASGLNNGGWTHSYVREVMNTIILNALPVELSSNIKTVVKLSDYGYYHKDLGLATTEDKIWLPSVAELGVTTTNTIAGQGTAYPVFNNDASRAKQRAANGMDASYWTRSTSGVNMHYSLAIGLGGLLSTSTGCSQASNVAYGFSL